MCRASGTEPIARFREGVIPAALQNLHHRLLPAGRTLYAVIFDDGNLEYMDTANHDLVVKDKVLTAAELIAIRKWIVNEGLPSV